MTQQLSIEEQIRNEFNMIDKSGDGKITFKEYKQFADQTIFVVFTANDCFF